MNELKQEQQRKERAERMMLNRSNLFAKIAINLDQLQSVCRIIVGGAAESKSKGVHIATDLLSSGEPLYRQKAPEMVETDGKKNIFFENYCLS